MCSFLLLFLLIVVGFDLLQNSNPYWNAKEARQAFAPASAASLVLTPHGCGDFESFCATTSAAHFGRSSFQGFAVFEKGRQTDHGTGALAVALCPLPTYKQKECVEVCDVSGTLDEWNSSQYPAKAAACAAGRSKLEQLDRMVSGMGRMERCRCKLAMGRCQARSQSRSQSQASTRSNKSESNQTKGKKNKGKGKGKGRKGTSGKETTGTMTAQSPFAPLTSELPPWPSLDNASSSLMPTVTPFTTQPSTETVAQKREVLNALRTAYTDSAQMPQETKDLIAKLEADVDRMEKEFSKATTKNLHSATKALGKAQKTLTEALEARKVHRNRWTQHVAEAAKTWEGQLHEFRQQQASLQEIATKARADIESARSAIQSLSAKATPAALAAMPPIAAVTAEAEDLTLDVDQEEETVQTVQQQLQTVLQSCAASLGVEVAPAAQTPNAPERMEDADPEQRQKRPRSLEPFGGGASSTPAGGANAS